MQLYTMNDFYLGLYNIYQKLEWLKHFFPFCMPNIYQKREGQTSSSRCMCVCMTCSKCNGWVWQEEEILIITENQHKNLDICQLQLKAFSTSGIQWYFLNIRDLKFAVFCINLHFTWNFGVVCLTLTLSPWQHLCPCWVELVDHQLQ